jgi:putative transposase
LAANLALLMGNARSVIKRLRFPLDIMLLCLRWYVAYALSLRNLEEMMQERGVFVDFPPFTAGLSSWFRAGRKAFRKRKRKRGIGAVRKSWRLDETYVKIRGEDRYWYRAVDKQGNTVDSLLTAKRDRRAAWRFFMRVVKNNRLPKIVNIDKSGANNAGIRDYNRKHGTKVVIRQCKYLNNIVEQDHRAIKRITRYKAARTFVVRGSFWVASSLCR